MYSRVKLQLYIIYTVVREPKVQCTLESPQTFLFASHVSIGLQRRQTEESLHAKAMQGTIRPAGAQAPRLVIVGPARSPIDHLRKKASERSSAIAQQLKPAMHNVHGHGVVLRPASVAPPIGNAHGAGQPMVIGPAKATGPAHSQHAAMCRMDQQPLPLPCEMAPSVTSMTGNTVIGSIRPASVGHANQSGNHTELRLQGGHSTVWRSQCMPLAALQPAHPPPPG